MTVITDEQRAFLDQHNIPLSRVFDAKGMKRAECQEAMRALDLVIAVGTSACKAAAHRMRTRAGHCAKCEPVCRRKNGPSTLDMSSGCKDAVVCLVSCVTRCIYDGG
jgi:hypothetical protein